MKTPPPDPRIERARYRLILDAPFFGALMVRLPVLRDDERKTFCTNGECIRYNQAYADTLTEAEIRYVFCHELMHCALGHLWRMNSKDRDLWNKACDYVVNQMLDDYAQTSGGTEAPWERPEGLLNVADKPQWRGFSAEEIYRDMVKDQQAQQPPPQQQGQQPPPPSQGQGQPQPGQGKPQPGQSAPEPQSGPGSGQPAQGDDPGIGDFEEPAPDENKATPEAGAEGGLEDDWKIATVQAEQIAKMKGNCPGGASQIANGLKNAQVDWREVLRQFFQAKAKCDYSFARVNRRHIARGFILPALHSERMGRLVAAFDSSGSTRRYADDFASELQAALDMVLPERLDVIVCDAQVQHVQSFEPGDRVTIDAKGGGGTDFRPVFELIDNPRNLPESDLDDEPPVCVVYLTDLDGSFPSKDPGYPVLWIAVNARGRKPPFGEVIVVN